MLKVIGDKILIILNNLGINTFKDALNFDIECYSSMENSHIYSQIIKIKDITKKFRQNIRPEEINHMNTENPYESKYGDNWREHICLYYKFNQTYI